ncbi:SRPBCC family protein [Cellulomonas sp. PhB143]|uniref:SRPBCC family protein n=1 Tax=Cellulomonas sp. PhB143 TaxID=2485186 RepID=UPI000F47DA3D|nr:SRPBCC family protein [Cellulomonas sp. PhB143]ROS73364.1 uncharacterized protein YndB with AHSA1/START domain [Cellulomonas sp. PhB143]
MSDETRTNHRTIGSLRTADGTGVVRMEDRYATDVEDLWTALTEPDRLSRWIAEVTGDLRLGGTFHARFTSSWDGPGRVDVCERPHHLVLSMCPGEPEETVIEAWLSADGDHTRLVVEERGFSLPEVAAHGAGWQAHVEDLAAHLADRPAGDWRSRWAELAPHYRRLAEDLS